MGFLTMVISFQIYLKFQEGYQSCHNSLGFRKTWNSKNMGRLFQMMMIQKHGSFNLWVQKLFFFGFFFGSFYPCTWKAGTSEITQLKGKSSSKAPFLGSMLIFRGVFARWLNIPKLGVFRASAWNFWTNIAWRLWKLTSKDIQRGEVKNR